MKATYVTVLAGLLLVAVGCHEAQAFYNSQTGRWLSRDPVDERGGKNLYEFCHNRPLEMFDSLGQIAFVISLGGVPAITVSAVPTLTATDVCSRGPLRFNVNFRTDYHEDNANRWLDSSATFHYDGRRTPYTDYQDNPMRWNVPFEKNPPVCPKTRQTRSTRFDASTLEEGLILTIYFNWSYRCDSCCNEIEPFTRSFTYFVFHPITPLP